VAYIVVTCWDYTDIHLLALHRFASAEVSDTLAKWPVNFDLQSYIDDGALGFINQPGAIIWLKARFTVGAAAHLWESRLASDKKITDDHLGVGPYERSEAR
jgi:hypothetical protein